MKYNEVAQRKAQHICIFGDPKSGKTELAASCSSFFKRVVWISMDNGHTVVFKQPVEQLKKFEFIILPDTKEFPVAIATCLKLVEGRDTHICNLHGQVNCTVCRAQKEATYTDISLGELGLDEVVVFDHGSQLSDSAMNFITKGKPLDYRPEWSDYSYQGALLNKVLMNLQQAPYNCIFITHTCETEMEDGSKRLVPLCGTVNFSRNMGKYFDHIIYCRVGNRKHAFGSATTYLASVLTGSREDVVLEVQNKEVETRPTLLPFFEGKMEHLKVEEQVSSSSPSTSPSLIELTKEITARTVAKDVREILDPKNNFLLSAMNTLAEESVGALAPKDLVNTMKEVDEFTDKAVSSPPPTHMTGIITPPLTPAEAAKQRLAAMRAAK